MYQINDLLKLLVDRNASDLHLKVKRPPLLRIAGKLVAVDGYRAIEPHEAAQLIYSMMSQDVQKRFEQMWEADFSFSIHGLARFRVNAFKQRGVCGAVIRKVPYEIPTFQQLHLPEVLKDLCLRTQGLILVTGPTGCGKSTTLAAMVDWINQCRECHIITIEDPIEFLHRDKKSAINQREVGIDTHSFREALRRALRQDPDVILIGEMRDLETMSTAMTAAETGHLVMGTLHTNDVVQTIDRIVDIFPPGQQQQVRMQLALSLVAVISQRLLRTVDGSGRVPAVEVMVNSPTISKMIEEGNSAGILRVVEDSNVYWGMKSLNQALTELVNSKQVSVDEALRASNNPDDLKLKLKGTFTPSIIIGDF